MSINSDTIKSNSICFIAVKIREYPVRNVKVGRISRRCLVFRPAFFAFRGGSQRR
nr:MAG TPA: hypothetical protein [Caudoviricetes sp.]